MNIGIIVLSNTGNTLSVSKRLEEALKKKGHTVCIERVTAVNENPSTKDGKKLKEKPDVSSYDVIIFASPVWAFSLASVMKEYLYQIAALNEKKVGCFVTQQFPYAWMGGKHAISSMKKICNDKGAVIFETGVVNWSNKGRELQIITLIENMCKC